MKNTILFLIASLFTFSVFSQALTPNYTLYNSSDTIYIQPGALLYIGDDPDNGEYGDLVLRGDSTVSGEAAIYNDGVISLTGDLFSGDTIDGKSYGNPKFDTVRGVSYSIPNTEIKERMVVFSGGYNPQTIKGYFDQPEASFFNLGIDKDIDQAGISVVLASNARVRGSIVWDPAQPGITSATYDENKAAAMAVNGGYQRGGKYGRIKTYRNGKDYELYVANPSTNAIVNYSAFVVNGADALKIVETRGEQGVGIGGLSREIGSTGVDYAFPVGTLDKGNNGAMLNFNSLPPSGSRKVRSLFVNVPDSSIGRVNYSHYSSSYSCNGGNPQWFVFDTFVANHGYWSFTADQNNNGYYKYVIKSFPNGLDAYSAGLISSGNNIRLLKYSDDVENKPIGDWSPYTPGVGSADANLESFTLFNGNMNACYNSTSAGIPGGPYQDFSHFQIGGSSSNQLPVELISLKAFPVNNEFIRVTWATATELNNNKFEVLRSEDGVNFVKVGEVKGNGTTTEVNNYLYNDKNVLPNITYYYRLNQVDFDGTSELTNIVSAAITGSENIVISQFVPNPAQGSSRLFITSPTDIRLSVSMTNPLGQELQSSIIELPAGVQTPFIVDASLLAAGNYIVSLRNETFFTTRRLVVTTH
ncbi:MAG: T9SS type A sorting domain-containing protein [Chitinophagales bacterium]|nr:T9SS type A sorting domain-containing protein [Chitinophagales bacterium]